MENRRAITLFHPRETRSQSNLLPVFKLPCFSKWRIFNAKMPVKIKVVRNERGRVVLKSQETMPVFLVHVKFVMNKNIKN